MLQFTARRMLWMIVQLLIISFVTFVIFNVLPSADPALLRAGRQPSPELVKTIRETLGLNDPWYLQYLKSLQRLVFHFDFGYSYQNDVAVRSQLFERLPATMALAGGALVVWLSVGIPVGIISAIKRGKAIDRAAMGSALVAISAPAYWLGLVSLYLLSKDIGIIPLFEGAGTYPSDGNILTNPGAVIPSLMLPWLVLAASFAAIYARFMRGSLLDVMQEDYVRTARAKGLRERRVIVRHGVRAAITPVVTIIGLDVGILLGGAVIIETVFNIPGIGRLAFDAIKNGDLPTVEGTVLLGAFFILLLNFLVDVAYAFIDPRVRT